ncbi:unnamed protein product [Linum trigynum]|uniref:Uncharacterized protein n=1 Tax=Linum trigynum TaxID=586398 RepID=A0AAV2ESI2_9ROSI
MNQKTYHRSTCSWIEKPLENRDDRAAICPWKWMVRTASLCPCCSRPSKLMETISLGACQAHRLCASDRGVLLQAPISMKRCRLLLDPDDT